MNNKLNKYLNQLNQLLLDLDNTYDINSGACALVASMLAKFFENHNISYATKVYYYDSDFECAWHYALIVDDIEINSSTYQYEDWEYEISRVETIWDSESLLNKYKFIIDDSNYWKLKNEKIVMKKIEDFLNNIRF